MPTCSEGTAEEQTGSQPYRDSGLSGASDPSDMGSPEQSHDHIGEGGNNTSMGEVTIRTDNDVDEGVDLQGTEHVTL